MEYYIYVAVKPYIRQWALSRFGNGETDWRIEFPAQGRENAFMRARLIPAPAGKIITRQPNEIGIVVPTSKVKPVDKYNYMTIEDRRCMADFLASLFYSEFRSDMYDDVAAGLKVKGAVEAWMKRNGVSMQHFETLLQQVNRMIMSYRKKGIELTNKKRVYHNNLKKKLRR